MTKRYAPLVTEGKFTGMVEVDTTVPGTGRYVRDEDFQKLEAECAALQHDVQLARESLETARTITFEIREFLRSVGFGETSG